MTIKEELVFKNLDSAITLFSQFLNVWWECWFYKEEVIAVWTSDNVTFISHGQHKEDPPFQLNCTNNQTRL